MAIITISRGSYSRGVEVAEKVAKRLGYGCLARDMVLEASEEYDIPEARLVKAIEGATSVLGRIGKGRRRYVAYIRATLLRHFVGDNLVYHGFVGHYFLPGIRHVLKARILADLDDRVEIVRARDGVSDGEARRLLAGSDKARRQWGLQLYGIDPEDPGLYDAVVHVGRMGVDGATDLICDLASQGSFATTPESQAALEDLALAAEVEAVAVELELDSEVTARDGEVQVLLGRPRGVHAGSYGEFRARHAADVQQRLYQRSIGLPGFKTLVVKLAD